MFWRFLDDINFVTRCRRYNIGIWQCPNFLFLVMGFLTIVVMFATYILSQQYYSETVTIVSVSLVAAIILAIGSFIIRGVEKIAEANIMKSEFISIISHQLCSPLSAIKWNIEILQNESVKKGSVSEKEQGFLKNIQKSNDTMLKLVNDLMELIRIDQGSSVFEKKQLDLESLAREVLETLEHPIKVKQVTINIQAEKDLPRVYADPKKVKIVMENLIGNAVKYSNDSGKVEVKLYSVDEKVFFVVKDYGVGIPKYQHSRVFQKFFRSNNSSKYRTDGIGIGLYLVKAILKYFDGKVWFDSEEGEGSTFYVSLPMAK